MSAKDGRAPADASMRNLARHALVYGLALVVSRAASFVMLPIYTRWLTPADYGVLHLVQMTLDVAIILLATGVHAGVLRFYFKAHDEEARQSVIGTSLVLAFGFNLVAATALMLAAPWAAERLLRGPEDALLVRVAAASIPLEAGFSIGLLWLQARQQSSVFAIISVARLLVQLALNVWLLVFEELGVLGVLVSTLVTNTSFGLLVGGWVVARTRLRVRADHVRSLLRFGLPYRVTQMGTFVLTFGDRYLLRTFGTLSAVGLYSLAYQFGFLLAYLIPVPFLRAWNPQRFSLVHAPPQERDAAYNRGFLLFDAVMLLGAVALALGGRPLLTLMADPEYLAAADLIPVIVLAYVIQGWKDVAEFGIQVSERTEFATAATWLSVAVALGLYLWWIPRYGAWGAAWATLASFTVRFLATLAVAQRLWPVRYAWGPHVRMLACGVAVVIGVERLRPDGVVAQIGWGAAGVVAFAALIWFVGVDAGARREVSALARERLGARAAS